MLKLLIIGTIAFCLALIDALITQAQSFSDMHGWGIFFGWVSVGIVTSWFVLLIASIIKKK